MIMPFLLLCGCSSAGGQSQISEGRLYPGTLFSEEYLMDKAISSDFGSVDSVGISLPTKSLSRWLQDGDRMQTQLLKAGIKVDLQYADNDSSTQIEQIRDMIRSGCDVLIIAPISSDFSLDNVLSEAKKKNITIIAYDRLIMDSDAVDYFVTYDFYQAGQMQAEHILEELDINHAGRPLNIEIFAGDPSDNNAEKVFKGAMDVLNPYIEDGKITVPSGQTTFDQTAIEAYKPENAQVRMENLIHSFYKDGTPLDAVLCTHDTSALGVADALSLIFKGGYPVITGLDCDIINVQNILAGKQSMSLFFDTIISSDAAANMAVEILSGKEPTTNDDVGYNNGKKIVGTYLCKPVKVDISNYKEILIDSGYYTEDALS